MAKIAPDPPLNSDLQHFLDTEAPNVTHVPSTKDRCTDFKTRFRISKPITKKYMVNETFKQFIKTKKEYTSESVLECPKCKGNKVSCISRQISRADESEDFFAKCLDVKCKYAWRFK